MSTPGGQPGVEWDVSGVAFLDSRGLVALLDARRAVHDMRRRLRNPSKAVLRVFELSGVLELVMEARPPPVDSGRARPAWSTGPRPIWASTSSHEARAGLCDQLFVGMPTHPVRAQRACRPPVTPRSGGSFPTW